jgi:uncharacterized DUF497 family protein
MREFAWDDKKAADNYNKHCIRFEKAKEVFDDPSAKTELNNIVNAEERWEAVGRTKSHILLYESQ